MGQGKPHLERSKRRIAQALLKQTDLATIRRESLANLDRWKANGVWVSALDEWRQLMTQGSDEEVIAAMTGQDERSTRLRASAPYSGLLDEVPSAYIQATREIENDADAAKAFPDVDKARLELTQELLRRHTLATLRKAGLDWLEKIGRISGKLSETQQAWRQLLSNGSDAEMVQIMTANDARALRMRLIHPFIELD